MINHSKLNLRVLNVCNLYTMAIKEITKGNLFQQLGLQS